MRAFNLKIISLSLLLIVFCAVLFLPVSRFEFLSFDDNVYISENPHIQKGLTAASLHWAVTADLTHNNAHIDYWQPLTALSHILDVEFFGLNAGKHHITNLILHIINVLLLFGFLLKLSGRISTAFWTVLLFAIHPVQVETLGWVTARKDLLAGCFALLSLHTYWLWVKKSSWFRYGLVLILFLCTLLSKPAFLFLPLLFVLLDIWPLKRFERESWPRVLLMQSLEKAPFWILAFFGFLIARRYAPLESSLTDFKVVATNSLGAYWVQFQKIFWPVGLGLYRSAQHNRAFSINTIFFAVIFLYGVTVFVIRQYPKRAYLFLGWFWFLISLAITTLLRFPADRFLYIPMIGICFACVCLAEDFFNGQGRQLLKIFSKGLLILAVMGLGLTSIQQLQYWRNDLTFFKRSLQRFPDNFVALGSLGSYCFKQGQVHEAIIYYRRAVEVFPGDALAHLLLANALMTLGEVQNAEKELQIAVELNPEYASAGANLGRLLSRNPPETAPGPGLDKI